MFMYSRGGLVSTRGHNTSNIFLLGQTRRMQTLILVNVLILRSEFTRVPSATSSLQQILPHPERKTIIDFGRTVLMHPPYNSNLAPSDSYMFGRLEKEIHEDTIRPLRRHCRWPCVSGCRRGIPTFTE